MLPAETRLPLLAMISWFLLSMLESLVTRGALISVKSTAMSPVLRVVVIFDCRGREREEGEESDQEADGRREGRRGEVRVFGLHLHNRYSELSALSSIRGALFLDTLTHHPPLKETQAE